MTYDEKMPNKIGMATGESQIIFFYQQNYRWRYDLEK